MTTLHSELSLVQSSIPTIRYLFVDGVNCGIIDQWSVILRKRVSEARLAELLNEIGERKIVGPPKEIPEEYY